MDMVRSYLFILVTILTPQTFAGSWQLTPSVAWTGTHSDNVNLTTDNLEVSWVNQREATINSLFKSKQANFTFNGTATAVGFSHNTHLNDTFTTLNASGELALGKSGAKLFALSNVANQSKNSSVNSLASITSGDTVQIQSHQIGIAYNISNSSFQLNSSISYNQQLSEDNIGESDGYSTSISAQNASAARHIYWILSSATTKQSNSGQSGTSERHQAKFGWINNTHFIPLISYYSESATGTVINNTAALTSYGPGIRWQVTPKFILELTYYFVENSENSDDYLATSIEWLPSSRTSLKASHSQRFFGDSYSLAFSHKLRRLTNTISYSDSINAFNRNHGLKDLGFYWCSESAVNESGYVDNVSLCQLNADLDESYQFSEVKEQENSTTNEFQVNKMLSWQSTLDLSRTTFNFSLSATSSKTLSSLQENEALNARLSISRKLSPRSTLLLSSNFQQNRISGIVNEAQVLLQDDYYRINSINLTRKFGHSLSATLDVTYTNRSSTNTIYNYTETRASLNLKKDF